MGRISASKGVLWALLAVPAAVMLTRYATAPDLLPGDLLRPTGEWSARMLIVALMLTPLDRLLPANRAVRWLIRHRRAVGVAAFGYAMLHLVLYIVDMETIAAMAAEFSAPGIWTAWLALLCLAVPALLSSDVAMRLLRKNWKRLQQFAYPAAVLTLAHWVLVHDGMTSALLHFTPLFILQALRLAGPFTFNKRKIA